MQSGQTLNDRLNAARYALAGQGLARVVCKATTEEMIAPKKKHIDYLLQCTNEPNVSIPQLANLLLERTAHSSWVVVFKALVTVHHLMCYGNERFTQYLASSNSSFQLSNYTDKTGPKGYDMSVFIRRYAKYLNTKALSYRTVAFDFTKIKRGGDGQLRAMNVDKLLKTIPVLQEQVDHLLEFECSSSDLTNQVINAAFFLLFKDLIRLFACYNDGIINCLEKFFEMNNKKQCREALDIYKKFLSRMNKVGVFLKVAENVGIDKGEIPDLTKAPGSLLDAMEQHLAALEGRKPPPPSSSNGADDETSARKAIEEEEKFLNKLKEKHAVEKKDHNPFLDMNEPSTSETKSSSNEIMSLFLSDPLPSATTKPKISNDLFSTPSIPSVSPVSAATVAAPPAAAAHNPFADILSSLNTNIPPTVSNNSGDGFATSDGFAAAFGSSSNSNIDNPSPTSEFKKGPPGRPPAPSPSTPSGPARPPPPPSRSGAATPTGDESRGPKPARPPAPSGLTPSGSGSSTPMIGNSPAMPVGFSQMAAPAQMQQFLAMQQQMMSIMALQAGAKDEASAAMMADQISKMQALCAAMTASMNITQTNPSNENIPKIETPTSGTPSESDENVKSSVQIEQLDDVSDSANDQQAESFDALGDVLQPQNISSLNVNSPTTNNIPTVPTASPSSQSLIKANDLDGSLASLALNLDINNKGSGFKKNQFNQSPKNMMKTGQPMSTMSTTTNTSINTVPATMWNNTPSVMGMLPTMNTSTVNTGWPTAQLPMMTAGQAMPYGIRPQNNLPFGIPAQMSTTQSGNPQISSVNSFNSDPFGAL